MAGVPPDAQTDLITSGMRVTARGDEWVVSNVTTHADCRAVRVSGCGRTNLGNARTLLTPFDRLRPPPRASGVAVVSRRRWLRRVSLILRAAEPFGGLSTAATADIRLLPFQIEPALAMLRHARLRLLIADEVGLGKTIQTGVILRQLASEIDAFRALILTPAGVREQWQEELRRRFALQAAVADSQWLAAQTRDLPPDVNPWSLPGIYIASLDLVKRPEVLRALEDVSWDIAVVDEVHGAGLATARLAAADAVARTARRVVLLTATPPDAEPLHFNAITNLGCAPGSGPLTQFRRSRSDADLTARRKSIFLAVRLSPIERRMHRLLERYTQLVWREASSRDDTRARLAAIILRKRALSSAASLCLSVRRRLLLLGSTPSPGGQQLLLPLNDEDLLDDGLADSVIGASGLSDVALERSCLEEIAAVAEKARRAESKLALLRRLLARTWEPMIIFTEYRDTLIQLDQVVSPLRPVLLLHGGMTPRERVSVQRTFNQSGVVLLATDAASEGLNLHERCRLVVHFELPWTPARLEQRTGRVDRLGQSRRVHEVMLVARHTCERLVLAPLLKRARTAAARGGSAARKASLTESTVASAVMAGAAAVADAHTDPPEVETLNVRAEAEAAVRELNARRRLAQADRTPPSRHAPRGVTVTIGRIARWSSVLVVVEVGLDRMDGRPVHRQLVPVVVGCAPMRTSRRSAAVARLAEEFLASCSSTVCARAEQSCRESLATITTNYHDGVRAVAARERAIVDASPSAARRLVQVGLFDAREANALAARRKATAMALLETDERLADLSAELSLHTTARVVAVRFGWDVQP
ncbi:MAG: DEAD/DEAH box helicase [Acidobacteriota bacterium]|nr:DEAD/DEAH box helicase [Acidobacteriota bacterium]